MEKTTISVLLLWISFFNTAQAQMGSGSGSGEEDEGGTDENISVLIGIGIGCGVVLLTITVLLCVCCVCCLQRRRRQKSLSMLEGDYQKDVLSEKHRNSSSSGHSTLSTITHSVTQRLLSQTSKGMETIQNHGSELTSGNGFTNNSNPLYNSSTPQPPKPLPRPPPNPTKIQTKIPVGPTLSHSPRRHSLSYVKMQPAGSALPGIISSRSMENFMESVKYDDVERRASTVIPPASMSYSPPPSPLADNLANRHMYLSPTPNPLTSSPSPSSPSHTPHISRGHEEDDDYEDPKIFQEDQDRIDMESDDVPEAGYDEIIENRKPIFTQKNKAYLLSTPNHDISSTQTTPTHTAEPQPDTAETKKATEPSYQNIDNDNAYLSDEYEAVEEFMIGSKETERLLEKAPQTNAGGHISSRSGPMRSPEKSDKSSSPDRTRTLDNQYVKVRSPVRSGQGSDQGSSQGTDQGSGYSSSDEAASPDHEYQNMVPGLHGMESEEEATATTASPAPVRSHKSPTAQRRLDSPKPRVKPKPDRSAVPPGGSKQRSISSSAVLAGKSQAASRLVIVSEDKKGMPERPHLEELVFPSRVVNGNGGHVVNSNGIGNSTSSDSRWRSETAPVSSNHSDKSNSIEEDTEVLYVNIPDIGGQDLYENVTHLT